MTKKQWKDAFTQGYACCLANAVQLESWNPRDISGGSIAASYTISEIKTVQQLRSLFPDGDADEMNFVLFSTSGIHGHYTTLEDIDNEPNKSEHTITVLVIQPRVASMKYGTIKIQKGHLHWLKRLRRTSSKAMAEIGYPAEYDRRADPQPASSAGERGAENPTGARETAPGREDGAAVQKLIDEASRYNTREYFADSMAGLNASVAFDDLMHGLRVYALQSPKQSAQLDSEMPGPPSPPSPQTTQSTG